MTKDLLTLFKRDLDRLHKEITLFNEEDLWKISGEVSNKPGNLALHIAGNLQHFIGAILGNTGYQRDREFEFNGKPSKKEIFEEIDNAKDTVSKVLNELEGTSLNENYPIDVFGHEMSSFYFLVHLQGHLNYHLGQINYCRRILSV